MPSSGIPMRSSARGFTLIEILVVIVIVATIVSIALLSVTSSYRFVEFDPLTRQWAEIYGDDLYRLRRLPEGLEFELFIDDRRIELAANPKELTDPDRPMTSGVDPYTPHLFLFARSWWSSPSSRSRLPRLRRP